MSSIYQVHPTMEHRASIVELPKGPGSPESARDFVDDMPFPANPTVWWALWSGGRIHHNLKLGEPAGEMLMSLEPHDSVAHILLSKIYAALGR